MASSTSRYLPLAFGLLSLMGAGLLLFAMFEAGCAGDPKGGALGDPVRALQIEEYGLLPMLLGAASSGLAITLLSKSPYRIAQGGAVATFSLVCLWLAGVQFEAWGIQACF